MLNQLQSISFDDQVYLLALSIIRQRIEPLSPEDRSDLFEVIREFITTDDDEARASAAQTIVEITDPLKTSVRLGEVATGRPAKWLGWVSRKIKSLRAAAGLTQEQLAQRSGLTQSHICRLENGEHSPTGLTLEKIAQALGVPTSTLDSSSDE